MSPFDNFKFRYDWRPYQQKVLDAIDTHLSDQRLHIVAAPGAGKTSLGLEVFLRLRKRTLVMSPTRVIRDQWISRLSDFCASGEEIVYEWVSRDITKPELLTSVTYQSLHSQFSNSEDGDGEIPCINTADISELVNQLKANKTGVIILDEAHHLRSEWWKALTRLCSELPQLVIVALTGTPPYDSGNHEWNRYEQLCGPIDEEISVPELVKAGTLCPHQDYIWTVGLHDSEKVQVEEYDQRVSEFLKSLINNSEFNSYIFLHSWLGARPDIEAVFTKPRLAVSLLVYLKAQKKDLPPALMNILDLEVSNIPELGRHWWQALLSEFLFSSSFGESSKEYVKKTKKYLRAVELLKGRELMLEHSSRLNRSLSLSSSKVKACSMIHKLELKGRGSDLCQVVLTDFIRDEGRVKAWDTGAVSLGAWPVFMRLIRTSSVHENIALLTGRLSVIHRCHLNAFLEEVDSNRFQTKDLFGDSEYIEILGPLNQITSAFTKLLRKKAIKVLVGTRSLLGEGWDCPTVNSLILASTVGSFMLTNQMRGRAIRHDPTCTDKISSIWHLAAIDTKSYSGLSDYYDLQRRFDTFVGLSESELTIESGFKRMGVRNFSFEAGRAGVWAHNRRMVSRYNTRRDLHLRWQEALTINDSARILPSVTSPKITNIRHYHFLNTLRTLLLELGTGLVFITSFTQIQHHQDLKKLLTLLMLLVAGYFVYNLPAALKALKVMLKHLPADGSLKQIGIALSDALCDAGLIETPKHNLTVSLRESSQGGFHVALQGGTFYESSLFADCMAEMLSPIDNPRYLIVRRNRFMGASREDYHAVPTVLGVKKKTAEIFYQKWCKYVCPTELIYTRGLEGKARLLKAKMRAFSSVFESDVKRQDRWQ
ncbi:MAG: DEAD/DEAH box helicase family protein [Neptuniibacter sp.]